MRISTLEKREITAILQEDHTLVLQITSNKEQVSINVGMPTPELLDALEELYIGIANLIEILGGQTIH